MSSAMLTEAAGVHWMKDVLLTADNMGPKAVYRIRKSPGNSTIAFIHPNGAGTGNIIGRLGNGSKLLDTGTSVNALKTFSMIMPEVRSKITCPHCKGKVVAYRPKQVERCEKCNTPFPPGKNVCPKDGTVRPAPPRPWKYCPLCGKELHYEG